MFDIAMAPFARLDPLPKSAGHLFARPEHTTGMTVLAGRCPWPKEKDTLFLISLLQPNADAAARAEAESANLSASLDALAAQSLEGCDEEQAVEAALAEYQAAKEQVDTLQAALAEIEERRAATIETGKNPSALRRELNEAKQAAEDGAAWSNSLADIWHEAKKALAERSSSARSEFFGTKRAELTARRDELRKQARVAIETIGAELLALDGMEKAVAAMEKAAAKAVATGNCVQAPRRPRAQVGGAMAS